MAAMIIIVARRHFYLLFLTVLLLLSPCCYCADPDTLQDFCVADLEGATSVNGFPCKPTSQVKSSDFFFDGFTKEGNTTNAFGVSVTPGNVLTFPGLNTLGIAMNRVDYAPGGQNPVHSHPRATEAGVVIKGKLLVGFVTTANVFHSKVLKAGEMFVIPRGMVHFQQNIGPGKALVITAFNSQLPGVVLLPLTLFASQPPIPTQVLMESFQVDEKVITDIEANFGS